MIAILDSGLGGLSVMSEIVRLLPDEDILYMADTANCPYGSRDSQEIIALSIKCVDYLASQGADIIVLACNTITSAAAHSIRQKYPNIPIVGMEPAIKPAATSSKSKVIGVLATKATLGGEHYKNTKSQYANHDTVIETAGEGLVEIVENQTQDTPESIALLRKYIEPMINEGADTIVLGCTHYPFLTEQIQKIAGQRVNIINPAPAVAKRTKELLELLAKSNSSNKSKNSTPHYIFISTKSEQATEKLKLFATQLLNSTRYSPVTNH